MTMRRRSAIATITGATAIAIAEATRADDLLLRNLEKTMATEDKIGASSMRLFAPKKISIINGWDSYTCSAHGWNKIPKPWKDMEVYASNIDWWGRGQDPALHFTRLGGPFDESALRIGDATGHMQFISSESQDKPMRVFGDYFNQWDHLWCLTNDSYTDDNTGGWIVHTRKTQ